MQFQSFELQIFVEVIEFVGAIPRVFLSTKKSLIWEKVGRFNDGSSQWQAVNVHIPNYMKYKLIFMVDERMNDLINSLGRYRFWIYNLGLSHSIGMHLLHKMTETNAIRQTAFHK